MHSGHWGGLTRDPAVLLAHAISTMMDRDGKILVRDWLPLNGVPAGVRGVLGTLWAVNSETGVTVVSDLFARLAGAEGPGPAGALAEAQRAYLAAPPSRARLHPRFWAPFIILGDGGR